MLGAEKDKEFHLFPCKIEYNGPAEVSKYFVVEENDVEKIPSDLCGAPDQNESMPVSKPKKYYKSTLRGRGLNGVELDCSEYDCLLISRGSTDQKWTLQEKASKATVWVHDQKPSYLNAPVLTASSWIQLANVLHE